METIYFIFTLFTAEGNSENWNVITPFRIATPTFLVMGKIFFTNGVAENTAFSVQNKYKRSTKAILYFRHSHTNQTFFIFSSSSFLRCLLSCKHIHLLTAGITLHVWNVW